MGLSKEFKTEQLFEDIQAFLQAPPKSEKPKEVFPHESRKECNCKDCQMIGMAICDSRNFQEKYGISADEFLNTDEKVPPHECSREEHELIRKAKKEADEFLRETKFY